MKCNCEQPHSNYVDPVSEVITCSNCHMPYPGVFEQMERGWFENGKTTYLSEQEIIEQFSSVLGEKQKKELEEMYMKVQFCEAPVMDYVNILNSKNECGCFSPDLQASISGIVFCRLCGKERVIKYSWDRDPYTDWETRTKTVGWIDALKK